MFFSVEALADGPSAEMTSNLRKHPSSGCMESGLGVGRMEKSLKRVQVRNKCSGNGTASGNGGRSLADCCGEVCILWHGKTGRVGGRVEERTDCGSAEQS